MMKYGIVQGRLVPQEGAFIQDFPSGWRDELVIAKEVGASHIEWILTPSSHQRSPEINPIFNSLDEIRGAVLVSGICMDGLVNLKFSDRSYRRNHLLDAFCVASLSGINRVILPLLEHASVRDTTVRREVLYDIADALDRFPVHLSLETDLEALDLLKFVKTIGAGRCSITLDTGNITKFGLDLNEQAHAVADYIDGIHVKDFSRPLCQTVQLGTGDTDLSVIRWLSHVASIQWMTFQTARAPGDERETFAHNVRTMEAICS